MPAERRLQILVVAHLVLGVVTRFLTSVGLFITFGLGPIAIVPFIALAFCQAFLLSFWVAVSQTATWKRLTGLVAGVVYLEALVPSDLRREVMGISTITITIVVTTPTLLMVRWLGIRLTRQNAPGQSPGTDSEGLKFSIRGLMTFTAVVALICAGARVLERSASLFLLIIVWALCFVALALVSLWAVLGDVNALRRVPVAFVLSPMFGVCFAFAAGANPDGWIYIILIMLLYPAALLASLLVVRSCGYRLVRRAVPTTSPPDDRESSQTANGVTRSESACRSLMGEILTPARFSTLTVCQ